MLLLGDSVAFTLQDAVRRAVERLDRMVGPARLAGVMAQPGFGVTADVPGRRAWPGVDVPPAPWYRGWQLRVAEVIHRERPHVVMVLVGPWDGLARKAGGTWLRPGEPEWLWWLTARIDATNELLTSEGSRVVWLGLTCLADPGLRRRVTYVVDAVRASLRARPGAAAMLDLDPVVCPRGRYEPVFHRGGDAVLLRMNDGVHFEIDGAGAALGPIIADELAHAVVRRI